MKITTLTLSPAFDVHCSMPEFTEGKENLVKASNRGIGGKGINISRALKENGIDNCALVVIGDENGDAFLRGMDACGLTDRAVITVKGSIRENITIHPDSGNETRISFKGFHTDKTLLNRVSELIFTDEGCYVTFTGSLPEGISSDDAEKFLLSLKGCGARVVIDSKSVPLDMLVRLSPWLIKPNAEELAAYFGELDETGIIEKAKKLHAGGIANALISLGENGAVLACEEGVFKACPPRIDAVSTIGAGDSMIAGFIAAASKSAIERLRTAIAYGSAACLTEGTNPPLPSDIARISHDVEIKKLS